MTNHPNRSLSARVQKWSDEKLDRELAFAQPAAGDDEATQAWLAACKAEAERRGWKV